MYYTPGAIHGTLRWFCSLHCCSYWAVSLVVLESNTTDADQLQTAMLLRHQLIGVVS